MFWERWRARRLRALSPGSHGAGDAVALCGSPGLLGRGPSVPAVTARGRLSPGAPPARGQPGRQAVPAVTGTLRDGHPAPSSGWRPSPPLTRAIKGSPSDEDFGSLPAWAGSGDSQGMGGLHGTAPEPSLALVPLSYRWQTRGCSLFHLGHRNYHFLPVILKLISGSEQTSRGVKAPDEKSVSP